MGFVPPGLQVVPVGQTGAAQVTFDNLPLSIELIRAERLRALAVASMTRSQALPEFPTVRLFYQAMRRARGKA